MKNKGWLGLGIWLGILAVAEGCATAPKQAAATGPQLVPLELYWNGRDNLTTATEQGKEAARKAGYGFSRIEGYVFASPQPGTKPLKQYWSEVRHDSMLLGTPLARSLKTNANYQFVRIEGYAWTKPRPGTVPLKRYRQTAGDNFTLASMQGETDAIAAGYDMRRIEAFVMPGPGSPIVGESSRPQSSFKATNEPPAVEVKPVSRAQIHEWIGQLGDADYTKRERAVSELAQHPQAALPELERALKSESNEGRRWWIQSAIQECQGGQSGD